MSVPAVPRAGLYPPPRTLPTDDEARRRGYRYDEAEAAKARRFIENHCRRSDPDAFGQTVTLLDWQWSELIAPLFGWIDGDGNPRFRSTHWMVPKKAGKSFILSAALLYKSFARPGAAGYCGAGTVKQAGVVFDQAKFFVDSDPALSRALKTNIAAKAIRNPRTGNSLSVVACGRNTALSGPKPTVFALDEMAEMPAGVQESVWRQVGTATRSRRDGLNIVATTAQYNSQTLAHEFYRKSCRVLAGDDDDLSHLPVIYAINDDEDWNDEAVWRRVNPSLGTAYTLADLRYFHGQARRSARDEVQFRVLHLNDWAAGCSDRWLSDTNWTACRATDADPTPDELRELCAAGQAEAAVGLDMGHVSDLSAAVVLVRTADGRVHVGGVRVWVPTGTTDRRLRDEGVDYVALSRAGDATLTPGDVVDYQQVEADLLALSADWRAARIGMDPWSAEQLRQRLESAGVEPYEVRASWPVQGPAAAALEEYVVGGTLRHHAHPVLDRNVANAIGRRSPRDDWTVPAKPSQHQKIDAVDALVSATAVLTAGDEAVTGSLFFR